MRPEYRQRCPDVREHNRSFRGRRSGRAAGAGQLYSGFFPDPHCAARVRTGCARCARRPAALPGTPLLR